MIEAEILPLMGLRLEVKTSHIVVYEMPCRRPTFRAVSRNFFFNVCCCDDAHGQVLLAYKMCINVRSGVSADPIIHA